MISLKKIAENTKHAPVEECPYTRESHGIVRMSPTMIAELAAAVHDVDEWAIVLQGTREQRGYLVNITGYRVPEQTRSSGHVELPPMDLEPEDVGVIHSHHKLGAFFSTTDTATLNPRFPMSIVIASKRLQYLGFDYKGTGKVTLPCGARAEVEMFIQPTEGPVVHEAVEVAHRAGDLGKCVNYEDKASDEYHVHYVAACGLEEVETLKADAFGHADVLLDQVKVLASDLTDTHEIYLCNECGKYDEFADWECGNCQQGVYCYDCDEGHDERFGCRKEALVQ